MPEIINNLSYVVLWLTSDCNLRCKYCYARAGEKQTYMSFDTAKKVLGSIPNPFKVQLSGGEPLLNFELVRQISSYRDRW
ncbi:radical SAM protein [Candidatus Contubernalis alkalaceticus]|uniref:radical SAM protein n=1 Tax=Candidatus Contubernalis alkaliaceticus TaxID=338645 RepID=UPI00387E7551|nr:4Fe-4S cluster-binding domain-containing protein [Candidatus Contubernalis alkalaceticus]